MNRFLNSLIMTQLLICLNAASGASLAHVLDPSLLDDLIDDTVAVQAAIDAVPEGGALHIPAGTLVLSGPLVIDREIFSISGVDANLTFLRFTSGLDGLVFQSSLVDGDWVRVADLSIQTVSPNAESAILGIPVGGFEPPIVEVNRVRVSGVDAGIWKYSLKMEGGSALVIDSVFNGLNDGTNGTLAHIEYSGETGGGGRVQMIRSRLSGARCGVSVHDTDSEGQKFYDSIVEDVSIGAERLTTEPTFQWMGCRITAEQTGLYLWGVRDTVFSGSVFEATAPDAKTIIMEHSTLQHLAFRGNILLGANTLTVPSEDYAGANSIRVDSVTFSGNYIQGADPVFDLSGSETYGFSFGGNMLKDTGQEFVVAPDTTLIFKTQTEEIQ